MTYSSGTIIRYLSLKNNNESCVQQKTFRLAGEHLNERDQSEVFHSDEINTSHSLLTTL